MASATTTNGSASENPSSSSQDSLMDDPLVLHHAENPSTVLARAIRKALLTRNKLGFIDGTLTLSSPLVSTPSTVQAWIRCDNMVGTCGPRVFNLQKEIVELHQGEVSTTDFFTQFKVLWNQLQNLSLFPSCTCGKCVCNINKRLTDLQVKESVMRFLMGLNDSFSQVRNQVLLMDPIPSLSKVYSLLIQEQTQRSVTNTFVAKVDSTVLAAKMPNGHANLGTNLASTSSSGNGKDRPVCTHCGKTGHTLDKCYKLHSFPLGFKFKNKPTMAHQANLNRFIKRWRVGRTVIGGEQRGENNKLAYNSIHKFHIPNELDHS
ncbi:hypothetical protein ACB092_08G205900 [Castanea dentata]